MNEYKTLRGFIKHLKWMAGHETAYLNGAEELTDEERHLVGVIKAGICNNIGELEQMIEERNKAVEEND